MDKITIVLADPDSVRLLHRALASLEEVYEASARRSPSIEADAMKCGSLDEAQRARRRSIEYKRRRNLIHAMRVQVPASAAGIPAAMGDAS